MFLDPICRQANCSLGMVDGIVGYQDIMLGHTSQNVFYDPTHTVEMPYDQHKD